MRRGENIYKRKDKRWEGRCWIGKKENGKPKYRSVYGKTLKEVREKLYPLKLKYQIIRQTQGESCITLQEWSHFWLNIVQPEIKQSTYANYRHKLTYYVLSTIGDYQLNELNHEAAKKLLVSLQERRLKPSTIQAIFRIVNQCINYAIQENHVTLNPFSSIKLPKIMKKGDQALTKTEQKELEKAAVAEEKGKGLPTLLALHAGLRIGEVSALAWQDIDFERNLIHVKSTFQRVFTVVENKKTELVYTSSKTAASARSIPMSQTIRTALLQHKKHSAGIFVFSSKANPSEPRLLTYHFHKIRERANLKHVHFHQLRHTFATRCIESNGDIKSVSQLMGHSSTKLTLDTYTSSLMEQKVLVVEQMERAIS